MERYKTKPTFVQAWQHNDKVGEGSESLPEFISVGIANETVRVLPDNSLHITASDGSVIPVPLNYWLTFNEANGELKVIAPDAFAQQFESAGE